METFFVAIGGFFAAIVVMLIMSAIMEWLSEKFGQPCPVGGSGAFVWPFIGVIPVAIGALLGGIFAASTSMVFWVPLYTAVGTYAVFGALSLLAKSLIRN